MKLWLVKVGKSDVCIKPLFANLITFVHLLGYLSASVCALVSLVSLFVRVYQSVVVCYCSVTPQIKGTHAYLIPVIQLSMH